MSKPTEIVWDEDSLKELRDKLERRMDHFQDKLQVARIEHDQVESMLAQHRAGHRVVSVLK